MSYLQLLPKDVLDLALEKTKEPQIWLEWEYGVYITLDYQLRFPDGSVLCSKDKVYRLFFYQFMKGEPRQSPFPLQWHESQIMLRFLDYDLLLSERATKKLYEQLKYIYQICLEKDKNGGS